MTTPTPRLSNGARTLALLVLTAAMLFVAAPARAATVGFDYWSKALYYVAAPGETNNLTISADSSAFQITDSGATIGAQYGCTVIDAKHATCPATYVKWLYVKTSDGDDVVSLQSLTSASVDCGTGTDTLTTPSTSAKLTACELVNVPPTTTPPATTPLPEPPAAIVPPLAIGQPIATMTQQGNVPLTLSCSAAASEDCVGTLVFQLPKKVKKSGVGMSRRGAPNILGKHKLSIAKGKKRKVNVAMTGKGRGMVNRRKRLRVTAKLKVEQGGKTTTTTQSLTIKAPRHRR